MAHLRIGVDVGGTNTDGVLLDPSKSTNAILAWHKTPTTSDPSDAIQSVIRALLREAGVDSALIQSVTIGTTVCALSFANTFSDDSLSIL
jgi:N-methylhydantoinase A/oxoprolinase/acetone carboxylase beta subunit